MELHNWIRALGIPDNIAERQTWINANSDIITQDPKVSDGTLQVLNNNNITNFDVGLNGSTFELKATAVNDGSTTIQNAISYYAIGLGDNTSAATSGKISTHSGVTFGGNNETRVDTVTATGTTTSILSTQRTLAEFTASAYPPPINLINFFSYNLS